MIRSGLKIILFFFLIADFCNGQARILFLNGKYKEVKQYELKGDWIYYKKSNLQPGSEAGSLAR